MRLDHITLSEVRTSTTRSVICDSNENQRNDRCVTHLKRVVQQYSASQIKRQLTTETTSTNEFDDGSTESESLNHTPLSDDNRAVEPPDPMPNSEVKRRIADGSVALAM